MKTDIYTNQDNNDKLGMTKVLVVEDNPLNMELVVEILNAHGFMVDEAIDGENALKKMETEYYDLVLMDIELPGLDGVEITKLIKEKYKKVPVIALTSYAMKGDRERFLAAGFDEYLSKPLDIKAFIKRLEKYNIMQKDKCL
jgi:two-component system cell cycle response regulator DivK